jgi:plastocyanin
MVRLIPVAAGILFAGATLLSAGPALAQGMPGDPNVIPMQGNQFVSPEITVPVGTTLTWVNMDGEAHDVIANDLSFESPLVNPGETWQFTFTAPGTFKYLCDLHVAMEGTVNVLAAAAPEEGF